MRGFKVITIAAMVMFASGCATTPAKVPVLGGAADISSLAGEWVGEYSSVETGRAGTIAFDMTADADSAVGGVLMTVMSDPHVAGRPITDGGNPQPLRTIESLSITFVEARDGEIRGRLDPYEDPSCQCMLVTTFVGQLKGNVIAGTYTSRSGNGRTVSGQWSVKRKRE